MISMFVIKTALLRIGIVVQRVSFDSDNKCLNVAYQENGKKKIKSVPFSEIEQLITSDPGGPAAPGLADPPPAGP